MVSFGGSKHQILPFEDENTLSKDKIWSWTDASGVRLTNAKAIQDEILEYYLGLLGSPFEQEILSKLESCNSSKIICLYEIWAYYDEDF